MEALLHGCMIKAPRHDHYNRTLPTIHHRLLLRVIGYRRKRGNHRHLSFAQALKRIGCQSVETNNCCCQAAVLYILRGLEQGSQAGDSRNDACLTSWWRGRAGSRTWLTCLSDDVKAFGGM